jgi:hypothetical protein
MAKYAHCMTADFKNESGLWVISYNPEPYVKAWTTAGKLWTNLNQRLRAKTKNNKLYSECSNNFKSFQEFAEWCQLQHGYLNKEDNGNYWSLDKDILGCGKSYDPSSCLFVPNFINVFFSYNKVNRGKFPIGVNFHKESGKFVAQCTVNGKQEHLGLYLHPMEAHKAWQETKLLQLEQLLSWSLETKHEKLITALSYRVELLKNQVIKGLETLN